MAPFTVLDDQSEDELHAKRLLRVEERPLERIKSRLLGPATPINVYLSRTATDATPSSKDDSNGDSIKHDNGDNNNNDVTTPSPEDHTKFLKELQRFRDDVILDFAAFEASIARIQFLRDANDKERQRYAAEKLQIEATAQDVRNDTARLKVRLDEAKKTLEVRKKYDVLAEKITKDARLKPRDEQHVNIERLKVEIEELEREGVELGGAWVERREQFGRVVEEGQRLRRLVRDEKEPEQEDKLDGEDGEEARENEDDDDDDDMLDVERQRDDGSHMGTPRPTDEAPTPLPGVDESGAMTPRSTLGDAEVSTPRPDVSSGGVQQDATMQEPEITADQPQELTKAKGGDEMDTS